MSDTFITAALRARVEEFEILCASNTHWQAVPLLRGAAQLALDVAELGDDQVLKAEAEEVIGMLNALERAAEDQEQGSRTLEWEGLEQLRLVRKGNYRLVQEVIGMEFADPRWEYLVELYQRAFPTFKVAASVKARISPKNLSAVLRKDVVELIQQRHRDQVIGPKEIEGVRGEAMQALERQTLRYLEKALPGFDFTEVLPTYVGA
ncbi:TPA: hypothetical protein NIB45_005458 [Pseudomonas aeruginosa]|nr:hypothetical protein [Pseudomonas aeruginosa]